MTRQVILFVLGTFWMFLSGLFGCTAESTRIAIESQERANQVQEAIFDRQHEGLSQLLYDATLRKLDAASGEVPLNTQQRQVLNEAWNERDLIEFWRVQFERSKALRFVGVDSKLFSDQSVIDLLIKALNAKMERGIQAVAAATGDAAADRILQTDPGAPDAVSPTDQP